MPNRSYEIRICTSCGLRYPVTAGNAFGTRCPVCMGTTRIVLSRELVTEPTRPLTQPFEYSPPGKVVLLDNIRSAWNVGSIFRSADGFGFRHLYLCGITPTPENEAVTKTSLGAEETVSWSYHKDAVKLVKGLKKEGWKVSALEEDTRAVEIVRTSVVEWNGQQILIVGNEIIGVDPELLDLCDQIFYIPMFGEKKSFNVAVAFGIAAFVFRESG